MSEDLKKDILKAIQDAQNINTQDTNGSVVFPNPKVLKQTMADYEIHYIWIPCEKRLPEEDGWYIGSVFDVNKGNHTEAVSYRWNNKCWYSTSYRRIPEGAVRAWCPFPVPYEEA